MSNFVKSAARVFEILELFDKRQRPLTLRELVKETGFPQSSTAALLDTMIQYGYILHDRRNHVYIPTDKVAFLGAWIPHSDIAEEKTLMKLLGQLHAESGETAVIATQEDIYVRYLHVKQAKRPIMHHTQAGVYRPLHRSACGFALLSMMDQAELESTFSKLRRREVLGAPFNTYETRHHIEEVKRFGFSVSRGLVYEHIGMVAVPVPIPVRSRYIAIGLGGPINRLDARLSTIVEQLKTSVNSWLRSLSIT